MITKERLNVALQSRPPDGGGDRVRHAIAAIGAGRPVVVIDDARAHGSVTFAASLATPRLVAFTVRHTSGFVRTALTAEACDRLDLPPMHRGNGDSEPGAYRVTVDLLGAGTGISAADRARTIAALASPKSTATDFCRPGHVVPVQVGTGGVLRRPWTAEADVLPRTYALAVQRAGAAALILPPDDAVSYTHLTLPTTPYV